MSKLKVLYIVLILFVLLCIKSSSKSPTKIVLITISNSTLEDFFESDILMDLALNGSIGLMNTKSNGSSNQYKPYLTMGSGEKSEVGYDCIDAYKVDDAVKKNYQSLTLNTCTEGNIVNLSINKIININSKTLYSCEPGRLGSILRSLGYKNAFIGGFWYDDSIKSPAFFINMDKYGIADHGEITGVFNKCRIERSMLLEAYKKYRDISDFIVIELGDMETLYAYRSMYNLQSYETNKKAIIRNLGTIVGDIADNTDFSNTTLCIISPYSRYIHIPNKELLSPVIIYDGGKTHGILTSKTTRRLGLVSVLDFAPFVLNSFGISHDGFTGYPIMFIENDKNVDFITELYNNTNLTASSRLPVLKGFAVLILAVLGLFIIKVFKKPGFLNNIIVFLMEFVLILPVFMLFEGLFRIGSIYGKVLFIISSAVVFTMVLGALLKKVRYRIAAITSISILGLIIDLISGQNMLKYSILSYDPIIGARYYGIGNEFSGVIIGCCLVFSWYIISTYKNGKQFVLPALLSISILIGFPWFGANTGGFITAVFTFSIYIMLNMDINFSRAVKISALLSLLLIILLVLVNMVFKDYESHTGRLASQVNIYGTSWIYNLVYRKVSMAVRLIKSTIWSRVFIAFIISSAVVYIKPGLMLRNQVYGCGSFKSTWICILTACFIAILTNDSGIVTSALIMLYGFFSMVLLGLSTKES